MINYCNQSRDVVSFKVKDAISAVANVDDYSGSARLLAATTLRHGPRALFKMFVALKTFTVYSRKITSFLAKTQMFSDAELLDLLYYCYTFRFRSSSI